MITKHRVTAALISLLACTNNTPAAPPVITVADPVVKPPARTFKHELKQDPTRARRLLTSPSGYQTVQQLDGGRTGLYYDVATDVLKPANPGSVRSIVMLGLGGGEMLRQASLVIPDAELIGVEIDHDTIELARTEFHLPPKVNVIEQDAIDWISEQPAGAYDVIMVDLFVDSEMVPESTRTVFFADCAKALRPGGLFLINVYPEMMTLLIEDRLAPFFKTKRMHYDNFVIVGLKN